MKLFSRKSMSLQDRKKALHDLVERQQLDQQPKTELHNTIRETPDNEFENLENSLKHKFGSARDQAEAITEGMPEKHLGEHTLETLTQEVVALGNTKPMFRGDKWQSRASSVKKDLAEQFKQNPRGFLRLQKKLNAIIQGEM